MCDCVIPKPKKRILSLEYNRGSAFDEGDGKVDAFDGDGWEGGSLSPKQERAAQNLKSEKI